MATVNLSLLCCRLPLSSHSVALTVAVLFLTLSLLGVRPTYASSTPALLGVVRGTDNGVYSNLATYTGSSLSWGGWARLPGGTLSAPTLCQGEEWTGYADLLVRGTDNGIYHLHYASGSWGSSWDSPGGGTNDQPACVAVNISGAYYLYVVVRGTDNSLYFNTYNAGSWGSWVALGGATNSPPTLIYDAYIITHSAGNPRLDLFVRGTDNGIYHKAGTISAGLVTWASSWESVGGATPSAVTALWKATTYMVYVFVRGTDNGVYCNVMGLPLSGTSDTFTGWDPAGGATSMAMAAGGMWGDYGYDPLIVVGTDSALYGTDFSYSGWYTGSPPTQTQIYASAGGTVTAPPAVTYGYPGADDDVDVLVTGTGGGIYFNLFVATATPSTAWESFVGLGGSTPSMPAITNIYT